MALERIFNCAQTIIKSSRGKKTGGAISKSFAGVSVTDARHAESLESKIPSFPTDLIR